MAKKYVIILNNVMNEIIEKRKELYGPEQISIFVRNSDSSSTYDILNLVDLAIGMKIKKNNKYYGEVVAFKNNEVTDANFNKAINYLINYNLDNNHVDGIPVVSKWVGTLN